MAVEKVELTCITCPMGCQLTATLENGTVTDVTGNNCPRGVQYAREEMTTPMRMLTGTVKCKRGRLALLPVVSAEETTGMLDAFIAQEPHPFLLNINFPKEYAAGKPQWCWAVLGHRDYLNAYTLHKDGDRRYYRLAGEIFDGDNEPSTDIYAVHRGLISITPLYDDLTNVAALRRHNLETIPRRPLMKQRIPSDVYADF